MQNHETQLSLSAKTLLEVLLGLRSGESMLLCVDEKSDPSVVAAISKAAMNATANCRVLDLSRDLSLSSAGARIVATVRSQGCDVLCELGEHSYYQSGAWSAAMAVGARVYSLAGLDAASFIRCIGEVDHAEIQRIGRRIRKVLVKGRRARIWTAAGTDLRMRLRQNIGFKLVKKLTGGETAQTWRPTGILDRRTRATFLSGQLSFRPEPGTVEGVAVVDGSIGPPAECRTLPAVVRWKFEGSRLQTIEGPAWLGDALKHHLGVREPEVEHLCLGFHPTARITGGILEAERVSGSLSIGIGKGEHHTDGVMTAVSIEVDGLLIQKDGCLLA